MRERTIENAVVKYARKKGILCYKFTSPGSMGVPDRIFFYKGRTLLIEFKAPGKKPTALQAKRILDIQGQHIEVLVVDDIAQGNFEIEMFASRAEYELQVQ